MSDQQPFGKILESLTLEIAGTRAGSDQGQFSILDLPGNLRDRSAGYSDWARLQSIAAAA